MSSDMQHNENTGAQVEAAIRILRGPQGSEADAPDSVEAAEASKYVPQHMSAQAAGMDVRASLAQPVVLEPGARRLVPCGFAMALPAGYEAQMRPRSGLALKHGVTVLNSPGTIDADYRGEVQVLLINHGQEPFVVRDGERLGQMVVAPVQALPVRCVLNLEATERGEGGFGSTGRH